MIGDRVLQCKAGTLIYPCAEFRSVLALGNHMTKTFIRPLPALVAAILAPGAAQAIDFAAGGWNGSFDTTISFGQTWREEARDPRLIATADGGTGRSPNIDDGDLNYTKGRVSSAYKLVAELSLDRENFGLFVRGSALYDDLVEDSETARTPISEEGKDLAGAYVRLLDAFIYGRWDLAGHELDLRLGHQVVNWGESTFIQGGINAAINHFDVAALRVPGSELREAYLPQEMLKVSFGLSDNLTAEAIGLFDWDPTQPEPVGTYFSSNDFVPRGGEQVFLGFGAFSDQGTDFTPLGGPFIENFQAVPRGTTTEASDSGQYGAALRWFMPNFGQGTELGFYLRQLPQQAAGHQRQDRHAGRNRQFARHADRRRCDRAGTRVGTPLRFRRRDRGQCGRGRGRRERRRPVGRDGDGTTRSSQAIRCSQAETFPGRRRRLRLTSTRRRRATSPSIPKTSSSSAFRSIRSSRRPASRSRARCPIGRTCRCSSTTSNSCSRH